MRTRSDRSGVRRREHDQKTEAILRALRAVQSRVRGPSGWRETTVGVTTNGTRNACVRLRLEFHIELTQRLEGSARSRQNPEKG
jgi:hypothetical protein